MSFQQAAPITRHPQMFLWRLPYRFSTRHDHSTPYREENAPSKLVLSFFPGLVTDQVPDHGIQTNSNADGTPTQIPRYPDSPRLHRSTGRASLIKYETKAFIRKATSSVIKISCPLTPISASRRSSSTTRKSAPPSRTRASLARTSCHWASLQV